MCEHFSSVSTQSGRMSVSGDPRIAHHEQLPGDDLPSDSKSSHNLHQSYSRPLSHTMAAGQARQVAQTPSTSHAPQHLSPPRPPSMESMRVPSCPPSRCSVKMAPTLPPRNIHNDIHTTLSIYEQNDPDQQILQVLTHANYSDLYNYFTYELPFVPA